MVRIHMSVHTEKNIVCNIKITSTDIVLFRPVVLHFAPKHIEVSLESFKAQRDGSSELIMDMFDAIMRRLSEIDDAANAKGHNPRKRHYFESDFVVSIIQIKH
jgi:hypothetical protein